MKRTIIILLFITNVLFAQSREKFLIDFMLGSELQTENVIDKYIQFDFSNIWLKTENSDIYGIIGDDHQRIRIKLLTVKKKLENQNEYLIFGKSNVNETICHFQGTISLVEIYEVKELHYGVDDEFADKGINSQGVLIANYEFKENKEQDHSGTFKGKLYTKWYLNSKNQIEYDNIEFISDGCFNNAFVGIWESYLTGSKKKICNWADYRVPNANKDFDIGVGEFNVSEKYWNKGWLDIALKNKSPNLAIKPNDKAKKQKEWWE
ncbi:hypothetical protein J2X69_000370 [Algoriphagus sp. 4150]|uniref:hypothetical protein n=1 Tax=Algoriphagus sp. 4150 TaxID=2817756 RepID=UPI0028668D2C|nr:hypothetical protein [Algoriphagus sp. 4150]MDR7128042.1 hypothetical protein [Algoriphagus sp. 4150]